MPPTSAYQVDLSDTKKSRYRSVNIEYDAESNVFALHNADVWFPHGFARGMTINNNGTRYLIWFTKELRAYVCNTNRPTHWCFTGTALVFRYGVGEGNHLVHMRSKERTVAIKMVRKYVASS